VPDSDTLWLQQKLNRQARNQALQAIQQTGRVLPCKIVAVNGSLVTVNFEVMNPPTLPQIEIPLAQGQWMRAPVQPGDYGITVAADASLYGIDGSDGGVADLDIATGNLSALLFLPVASTVFSAPPREGMAWANGPHGARIGDSANTAYIDVNTDTRTVMIHAGGNLWTFGPGGFTMSSGIIAETHLHPGVQGGPSDTGPPIA
jgi:hypothetical protein